MDTLQVVNVVRMGEIWSYQKDRTIDNPSRYLISKVVDQHQIYGKLSLKNDGSGIEYLLVRISFDKYWKRVIKPRTSCSICLSASKGF